MSLRAWIDQPAGRLEAATRRASAVLRRAIRGGSDLAHHGIQRSGTNYLLLSLNALNVPVLNKVDPDRGNPRHKHFRWYEDKDVIPKEIREQYGNTITAHSVKDLNTLAGYPDETRHLIVEKDETAWLASILNWGLRCQWFPDRKTALSAVEDFRRDHRHYHAFWRALATAEPERVVIIPLSKLQSDPAELHRALRRLRIPFIVNPDFDGSVDEVPQSPRGRIASISQEDVERQLRLVNGAYKHPLPPLGGRKA